MQPRHPHVGDPNRIDAMRAQSEYRLIHHRHISRTSRHHEHTTSRPHGGAAPQHRGVRGFGHTVRGLERLALILVHPRHQNGTIAVVEQLGHDPHALLGRLARRVHGLGCALPNVSMMVHQRVPHISERKASQAGRGIVG